LREGGEDASEVLHLVALLARLELRPLDLHAAQLATELACRHRPRAADATHLATAVAAGAHRFLTNRRDLPRSIAEIDAVCPDDLPEG